MIIIENEYKGNLRTWSKHLNSGNEIITDAPVDNNGKGEAFSPTDLVSSALASCMMTIMGIIANREEISLEGLKSNVEKIMNPEPRKISEIRINFYWNPGPDITQRQIKMLKNAALTCPVALSISPEIKQEVTFHF